MQFKHLNPRSVLNPVMDCAIKDVLIWTRSPICTESPQDVRLLSLVEETTVSVFASGQIQFGKTSGVGGILVLIE